MRLMIPMKAACSFIFVILSGCTDSAVPPSTPPNTNPPTTTPPGPIPLAPTNLIALATSENQINLQWVDNSTNEQGFKIERKSGGGVYAQIGTTQLNVTTFNNTGLAAGTNYSFRVLAFNSSGNSSTYSNEVSATTQVIPSLTTSGINTITLNTAVSGGVNVNDGGMPLSAKGLVWSISPMPDVSLSTKTNEGPGGSDFSSNIVQLQPNTVYYARAYATSLLGTGYGNEVSFTTLSNIIGEVSDVDGNVYRTALVGTQKFMIDNLKTTKYANGDPIPNVADDSSWAGLTTGAWCYFNNDSQHDNVYGKLYNWYVTVDPRGICPTGWRVPSNGEWQAMINEQGGDAVAGGKLKSLNSTWLPSPNSASTNESGFSAEPSGSRNTFGLFDGLRFYSVWWSTWMPNPPAGLDAFSRSVHYNSGIIQNDTNPKSVGNAIRCIKN